MPETILCIPNRPEFQTGLSTFEYSVLDHAKFLPRTTELETNERWRQVVPYVICWHRGRILVYRRTGTEGRLKDLQSIGFGGHIEETDLSTNTVRNAAARELKEEIGVSPIWMTFPLKLIVDNSNPVGKVHIGVLFQASLSDYEFDQVKPEGAIGELREVMPADIDPAGLENWSRLVWDWVLSRKADLGV